MVKSSYLWGRLVSKSAPAWPEQQMSHSLGYKEAGISRIHSLSVENFRLIGDSFPSFILGHNSSLRFGFLDVELVGLNNELVQGVI